VSHEIYVELQRLYAVQAHAIDAGDARGWAETFTSEGSFESPTTNGRIAGSAELATFAARYAPDRQSTRFRHWMNQLEAYREPDGSVTALSYGALLGFEDGESPTVLRTSLHRDRLERTERGWRIVSRLIEPDVSPANSGNGGPARQDEDS